MTIHDERSATNPAHQHCYLLRARTVAIAAAGSQRRMQLHCSHKHYKQLVSWALLQRSRLSWGPWPNVGHMSWS
jgi:hypothetical protein